MPYTTPKRVMCPFCGSRNTGKYVYGLPGPELFEVADKPDPAIIIGGCCIELSPRGMVDPSRHCHACNRDFGRPSKATYKEKGTLDLYLPCVEGANKIEFEVGGYDGPTYAIQFTPASIRLIASPITGSAGLKYGVEGIYGAIDKTVPFTTRSFRAVARRLFHKFFLADWKREYLDLDILDGEQWQLTVHFDKASGPLKISGSNVYPPYYRPLLSYLRKFFHNNGLPFVGDDFFA